VDKSKAPSVSGEAASASGGSASTASASTPPPSTASASGATAPGGTVDACCPPAGAAGATTDASAEGEAAEASDLDQPVEELLQRKCEHGILQYTCDECRYEVGMVKVDPSLFVPGGLLETGRVVARALGGGRELNGEVTLDAGKSVQVTPRAPGVVRDLLVDVGSTVSRGQALLVLDSPDLADARSAWHRAQSAFRLAEATANREADLFAKKVCPKKDLLEAEAVRDQAKAEERAAASRLAGYGLSPAALAGEEAGGESESRYTIRAPFAGRVLERSVNLGASVEPGQELLLLGDTARLWVLAQVYEREIAGIVGAQERGEVRAEIAVPAFPGRSFAGVLDRMSGVLDESTRTARIRVLVDNPEGLLRAGMFAKVNLQLGDGGATLAVPTDAVVEDEGRAFVFVPSIPPYFIRRPVTTGRSHGGWTEIVSGPREGDTVVTRGAFQLKSDVLRSKMGAGCAD
jgi:cobalt-zinc-cadmium efflux system membrane fusion protein